MDGPDTAMLVLPSGPSRVTGWTLPVFEAVACLAIVPAKEAAYLPEAHPCRLRKIVREVSSL